MKTRGKKALALLLSLLMVVSLFGGLTIVSAEGDVATYYQSVAATTPDQAILVVAESAGVYYALSYDGSNLGATPVTVAGAFAKVEAEDPSGLLWIPRSDNVLESALDTTKAIFSGSNGLTIYDCTGNYRRTFVFDGVNVKMHNKYYLTLDGSAFGQSQDAADAAVIRIFAAVDCGVKESAFTADVQYAVVAGNDGEYYALTNNDNSLGAVKVGVDLAAGIVYNIADDTALWIPRSDGVLESAADTTMAVFSGSNGLTIYDCTGNYRRTFAFDGVNVKMHNKYYLTFDGSAFGQSQDVADAAEILIFRWISLAKQFTITFDANAEGVQGMTDIKTEGKPYVINETLVREGYAFDGWNTEADGSGTAYAVGSTITEDADLTLYAVWTEVVAETYERTTELIEHYEYVVIAELDGQYYALSYDGSNIGIAEVTVDGETFTTDQLALRWILSEDNELESAAKSGTFLYPYSGGMTYSSGRKLEYDEPVLHFPTSSAIGYVTFDGSKFGYSNNEEDAANISLFVREIEWVEPPQTEPAPIPAPDTITRSAVKNADGSITLAFTSDTHHDGSETTNLQEWVEASGVGYIDAFGFCGDMGSAYLSGDDYWNATQQVMDYMDELYEAGQVGSAIYTHGNHEWFPTAGGDYGQVYQTNTTAQRLRQVGPGLETEDYIIYCFGAGEIAATMKYDYNVYDVEKMAAYLETAPTDIPIFILTHFPIHEWYGRGEERYMKHADPVIDALNAASESGHQIIVLWGHNHSDYDDNYYAPVYPGEEIVINPKGDKRTLNFTYLSAGCTADAEYTGPSAGSAACMNKGLIVTINPDKSLSYTYYTMDGHMMNVESPWLVRFRDSVDYEVFYTPELVEDGDTVSLYEVAKAAPEKKGYTITGWKTWENGVEVPFDFEAPITRNMLVTAAYEEFIDDAAGDITVYMTISVNGETKVIAEPLAIAPRSTYDDALKALHEKYAESDSSIVYRASSNNDYNMYLIESLWGVEGTPYTILNGTTLSETVDSVRLHEGDNLIAIATNTSPILSIGTTIKDETTATLEVLSWSLDVESFTYSTEPYANATVTNKAGEVVGTTDENGCIDVAYPGDYVVEKSAIHVDAYEVAEAASVEYVFDLNAENLEPVIATKYRDEPFAISSVRDPFRIDYEFVGWNAKRDGTGEMFKLGDTIDVDVPLTFYAIWEATSENAEGTPASGTGSTGTGSTDGSDKPVETEPEEEKEPAVVAVEASVEDGVATAVAEDKAVTEAAKDEEKGTVVLQVAAQADTTSIELSAQAVKSVAEADKALVFSVGGDENTPATTVELNAKTLSALAEQGETVSVQFQKNEDGSLTLDVKVGEESAELEGGLKVSLPAETAPGQVLVVVAEDGTETVVRKSVAEDGEMTALLEGGATIKIVDNAKEFDDVDEGAWYAGAVDFVSSHELFVGDENGAFNPTDTMTRAMMAMVMFRLEGEPEAGEGKSFADVEAGKWYAEAVNWASAEGVMNGYGESFGVNDPVTREQMAVLLYNYVQSLGIEVKKGSTEEFSDAGDIHSWAADAMAWAVSEGIFRGDGQGKLNPTGEATRADVATLMERVVKLLLK